MSNKPKKVKKDSKAKFVILTLLRSLFSNDAAIDGAKKAPWWMAIILFVSSVLLPLVPVMTSTLNAQGSSALSAYASKTDMYLTKSFLSLEDQNIKFVVKDGECIMTKDGAAVATDPTTDIKPICTYESIRKEVIVDEDGNKIQTETELNQIEFNVYYSQRDYSEGDYTITGLITDLGNINYRYGTKDIIPAGETIEGIHVYTPSFLLIYKTGIYMVAFNQDSTTPVGYTKFVSDWNHSGEFELVERMLTVEGFEGTARSETNPEYVKGAYANFKGVIDEVYTSAKLITLRNSLLIYGGVYVILIALMGFMVWVLTRGKNNPFNYLNYLVTTKIACWSALSPALLGMILGFIFAQYAPFIFIVLLGIRIMWVSMKQLRPYQ